MLSPCSTEKVREGVEEEREGGREGGREERKEREGERERPCFPTRTHTRGCNLKYGMFVTQNSLWPGMVMRSLYAAPDPPLAFPIS